MNTSENRNEDDNKIKKAVSLRYTENDNAPKITAKGINYIAEQILQLAKENDIPIHKDEALVNVLYAMEIGYEIPEILYKAIAELLAFLYIANSQYPVRKGGW